MAANLLGPFINLGVLQLGDLVRELATVPVPPLPPKQDPWYRAPDGLEKAVPGAVFDVRAAPEILTIFANAAAAYQILYRTTDSQYRPTFAVTTLFVPKRPIQAYSKGATALLSYLIP
ncbi:LIP-domain-containing protein [Paramyrothecium foliicola]|nr:LIP-domain-containing protein [Paramyrothecium foliicola]